jgi:hypothetical protein
VALTTGCLLATGPREPETRDNEAPVAEPIEATTKAGVQLTIVLSASDAENDALSFSIVTPPANGSVTMTGGNVAVYTPNAAFVGVDSFTYRAGDGVAVSAEAAVAVAVTPAPIGGSTPLNVMDVVLVRDTDHAAGGDAAREEMLLSTMLYQRRLAHDLDLFFRIREESTAVDLLPAVDPVAPGDLLSAFRTWKNANLDTGAAFEPTGVLYSAREWDGNNIGLSFIGTLGSAYAVSILQRDSPYSGSPQSQNIQTINAAHQMGHHLGASHDPAGSPSNYIMNAVISDTDPDQLIYSPASIAAMQAEIDSLAPLPTVTAYPLAGAAIDEGVMLAWEDGLPGDEVELQRSGVSVPLSCFDCEVTRPASSRSYHVDTNVASGKTYHYRLVARTATGELAAVTREVSVTVP